MENQVKRGRGRPKGLPSTQVHVTVTNVLLDAITAAAKEDGLSVNDYIRYALMRRVGL